MTRGRGTVLVPLAFAFLSVGFLPTPAEAAHCDNSAFTPSVPDCQPNHVHVDNWPTPSPVPSPSPTATATPTPASACDPYAGARPVVDQGDGVKCEVRVYVQTSPDWLDTGVFAGTAVLAMGSALVVSRLAR